MAIMKTNGVIIALMAHKAFYGDSHTTRATDQLIEEMAELTQALLHHRRFGLSEQERPIDKTPEVLRDNILTEIADVAICLEFICDQFSIDDKELARRVGEKANRLDYRLSTARKEPTR